MDDKYINIFADSSLSERQTSDIIWSGKHISAWYFLRKAVRSSLKHSIFASIKYLEHCQTAKENHKSLAERSFLADVNYSMLLPGPLLSAIIFSASSIEAFTRHCFVSTLKIKSHKVGKHEFQKKLVEFDKTSVFDRITLVISAIKSKSLPSQLNSEVQNLFHFRNDVMHSDPIYLNQHSALQTKTNKSKNTIYEREPRQYDGYYPDLTFGTRPLHLKHALLSTTTHDNLIKHVLGHADSVYMMEFFDEIEMTGMDGNRIWGHPVESMDYVQACNLAEDMNIMNRELDSVTFKEIQDFLKKLKDKCI